MPILPLLIAGWALSALLMTALWAVHLRLRNAGIVDVGWAASLPLIAVLCASLGPGWGPRRWLLAAMVSAWGIRLAAYLLRDRVLGKPEDGRYADLRSAGSPAAAWRFFPFFQAQAVLATLLSAPAFITTANTAIRFSAVEIAAAALWCVAVAGETIADRQLEGFRRQARRGTTCRDGLWRYSRHPNYFFEWLVWVAYALYALGSPYGVVALACPALMLYLLFRVTGIPATEAQALRSRGDDYRHYQETTSVFVPWFPRPIHPRLTGVDKRD